MFKRVLRAGAAILFMAAVLTGCGKKETYRSVVMDDYSGKVSVYDIEKSEDVSIFSDMKLYSGERVTTEKEAIAVLLIDSDKHIEADENTCFEIEATGTDKSGSVKINLLYGTSLFSIDNKLNEDSTFEVNTPNATMSVRGTIFSVTYDADLDITYLNVIEGTVETFDRYTGEITLVNEGNTAVFMDENAAGEDEKNLSSDVTQNGEKGQWYLLFTPFEYTFDENGFVTSYDQATHVVNFSNDGTKYTEFSRVMKDEFADMDEFYVEDYGSFDKDGRLSFRLHGEYYTIEDRFYYEYDSEGRLSKVTVTTEPYFESYTYFKEVNYTFEYDGLKTIVSCEENDSDSAGEIYTTDYGNCCTIDYTDSGLIKKMVKDDTFLGASYYYTTIEYNYNDENDINAGGSAKVLIRCDNGWDATETFIDNTYELPKNPKTGDMVLIADDESYTQRVDTSFAALVYFEDPSKALLPGNWPNAIVMN